MDLDEAGLSAAEAALINQRLHAPDKSVAAAATAVRAYLDNAPTLVRTIVPRSIPKDEDGSTLGVTHKFSFGGVEGYITVNCFEDGTVGEVFLHGIGKDGSTVRGLMDSVAVLFSVALQYGVPLDVLIGYLKGMEFEPKGPTNSQEIPEALSLPDYLANYLERKYG